MYTVGILPLSRSLYRLMMVNCKIGILVNCKMCAFQTSGLESRIDTKKEDLRKMDWLFPETTKNFNKLPLQYRVGITLIAKDLYIIRSFSSVSHA